MIQTLKLLGQISTNGSGVLEVDDFKPDPDQLEETSLSEQQARELLATIQEHRDLTQEELETICSILGIEAPESDVEGLKSRLNTAITSLVQTEEFLTSSFIGDINRPQLLVSTRSTERLDEHGTITFFIEVCSQPFSPTASGGGTVHGNDIPPTTDYIIPALDGVTHNISVSPREGITDWIVAFNGEISWSVKSEAMRQVGQLIPVVIDELENTEMEPGRPEDIPDPVLKSNSD